MLQLIKQMFLGIVDDIDAGNTNMTEEDCIKVITLIKEYAKKNTEFSKYEAYTYLNIKRARFDSLVKDGLLPKGKKVAGFKELRWYKEDLDEYVRRRNKKIYKGKQSDAS